MTRPIARVALLGAVACLSFGAVRDLQRSAGTLTAFDEVWKTVNETFFDPTFGGQNWTGIRDELRPRVEQAADDDAGRQVIRDMLARLGQSHFSLLGPSNDPLDARGEQTTPFDVRVVGDTVLVTDLWPAASAIRADIERGDRLLAIDDRDVASLVSKSSVGAVANERAQALLTWRHLMNRLSGPAGLTVILRLRSASGRERTVSIARTTEPGTPVAVGNLPLLAARLEADEARTASGRRVGVIHFNIWMAPIAEPFAAAIDRFRTADGLVIDLRGNPGGLADMIRGIAGHLVREPVVLGRMHTREADLEFRANPRLSTSDGRRVAPFAGPVAILVDGLTGSASECFTGGLQSLGRARVFGTETMGQALPAATKQLANGDVLLYAIGDFVTSTGVRLEGQGVVPDEPVEVTAGALAAGRDARAAALAWLDRARP